MRQEATLYIGNVDQKIDDEILWELMVQAGPVASVHLPKDKITQNHMGYGFIEFKNEEDADYAIKILNMIKLFGKPIRLNKSSRDKRVNEVGANLFVGNLGEDVDEKTLYDTFAAFGLLLFAKVMRDEKNETKGFGFISYDTFEAADNALANMNGQFLCNRPISVSYAYKKDSRGERHGSAAERLLADHRPVIEKNTNDNGNPGGNVDKGGKGIQANRGKAAPGGGAGGKGEKGNVRPPRFVPQAKHPSMLGGKNTTPMGKGATSKAPARPPSGMPPQMGRPTMTAPPPGMPAPPSMGMRPPQGMPPMGMGLNSRNNAPIGMPLPPAGMPMPPPGMMGGRMPAPPSGGPPRPMIPTSTGGPPRPPK